MNTPVAAQALSVPFGLSRPFRLASCLLLLASCSGGGGGASDQVPLNQGSYSIGDFDYVDTHPTGFHPLGNDGFRVMSRDELFAIYPNAAAGGGTYRMQDGPDAQHVTISRVNNLFDGLGEVRSATSGQLDDDPEDELIVATVASGGSEIAVYRADRLPTGDYSLALLHSIPNADWTVRGVRVSVGDVDKDFRDEVIVVGRSAAFHTVGNRGKVWVFDDPEDGSGELLTYDQSTTHINLWGLALDVDGDHRDEIVVGLGGDSTDAGRYAVRMFDLAEGALGMDLVHGWQYFSTDPSVWNGRAVVGDFDGNGIEDLAWCGYSQGSSARVKIKLFEFLPGDQWQEFGTFALLTVNPQSGVQAGHWDVASYAPSLGQSNLAIAFPDATGIDCTTLQFQRNLNQWDFQQNALERYLPGQAVALQALDVEADGEEEIQIAMQHTTTTLKTIDIGYVEHGSDHEVVWQPRMVQNVNGANPSPAPVPVLAPGDFDADGIALQHTGRRFPHLGSPVPIVLLSAAPTVTGISQNYDDTETAYQTGIMQGTSISATSRSALRKEAATGLDLDIFFGYEARYSVERASERTVSNSKSTNVITGFRGSYTSDVIIFQGTLYESYEYVIVGTQDADALGTLITLDIPIDANIYKWTVDYYNSKVESEDRISADLRTHTPGEITSYPSRLELLGLMQGDMHWDLDSVRTVSQGDASDYQIVDFTSEGATAEQLQVSTSYGGSAKILGIGGGADQTEDRGTTHTISYGSSTGFEATIGDISNIDDYENYRYNWGFSVHTVGRYADDENNPAGYSNRKHSFQYLRYWVQPTGLAY